MGLIFLACLLLAVVEVGVLIDRGNNRLVVSHYTVRSVKINWPVRVVHLSNLHNKQFGKSNHFLVRAIMRENPDMIVFTGDLEDRRQNYKKVVTGFLTGFAEALPVLFVYGNQETMGDFKEKMTTDLKMGACGYSTTNATR